MIIPVRKETITNSLRNCILKCGCNDGRQKIAENSLIVKFIFYIPTVVKNIEIRERKAKEDDSGSPYNNEKISTESYNSKSDTGC